MPPQKRLQQIKWKTPGKSSQHTKRHTERLLSTSLYYSTLALQYATVFSHELLKSRICA